MLYNIEKRILNFNETNPEILKQNFHNKTEETTHLILDKFKSKNSQVFFIEKNEIQTYSKKGYKIIAIKSEYASIDEIKGYIDIYCIIMFEYKKFSKRFKSDLKIYYKEYPDFIEVNYNGCCGDINTIHKADSIIDKFMAIKK